MRKKADGHNSRLRPLRLSAEDHGCASRFSTREAGNVLLEKLADYEGSAGIAAFLRQGLCLPLTKRTVECLRNLPEQDFRSEYLPLRSPMERHANRDVQIIIPNVWQPPFSAAAVEVFTKTPSDLFVQTLSEELCDLSFRYVFGSESDVLEALESTLPGRFPQLHISTLNFRCDAAMPRIINISNPSAPVTAKPNARHLKAVAPLAEDIVSALALVRKKASSYWLKKALDRLDDLAASVNPREATVARALWFILKRKKPQRRMIAPRRKSHRRIRLSSVEKYMSEIERAYDAICEARDKSESSALLPTTPTLRRAYSILYEILDPELFPDELFDQLKIVTKGNARPFDLLHPEAYLRYYGLHLSPPEPSADLVGSARRVIACMLYYSGRRAVCTAMITLRDIRFSMDAEAKSNAVEIRVPYTKNRFERDFWCPVWLLWPDSELDHLKRFKEEASKHYGVNTQLMEVAGLSIGKPYTMDTVDIAQVRLANNLVRGRRVSTHLGRINFASWWTVRVWCCQYPVIRYDPLIQSVEDHFWFTEEGLNKLSRILNTGSEQPPHRRGTSISHLEIVRRLMGLGTKIQYIERYNRGWPIEMLLWGRIKAHLEKRVEKADCYWKERVEANRRMS